MRFLTPFLSGAKQPQVPLTTDDMWGLLSHLGKFKTEQKISKLAIPVRNFRSRLFPASVLAVLASSFVLGGIVINDASARSLDGVEVDSAVDPLDVTLSPQQLPFLKSQHKLIALGIRSVTFLGFKVYGVGLYISAKDESKINSIIQELLQAHPEQTVLSLLLDRQLSQQAVDNISKVVSYAVKISPIRNTDFNHMKDGLTKSVLANPMGKEYRDEVTLGVEELRKVFQGYRGSFPKNKTLWVVSDTGSTTFYNDVNDLRKMGTVAEPIISRVLLVSYLSSLKPLSESLRESFVSYASDLVA